MNQELPLADIHTPAAISAWPPAYGWWILAAIIILLSIWLYMALRKRQQKRIQQNFALTELNQVNLQDFSAGQQINEILKRAAMVYYTREQVASLTGNKWKTFLLHGLKGEKISFNDEWLDFGYSATIDTDQVIAYHQFAKLWLSKALPGKGDMPDFTASTGNTESKQ